MPATAKVGSNYQITGQVLPKISGVTVLIKRNGVSAGSYITDASGGFNFTISEKESSLVSYQASISANANIKAGSSEIHPLLVR
jgi:hypothetical protein